MHDGNSSMRTMAVVRIAASLFFLLFGEYKVAGPGFAHGGFQTYLQEYIGTSSVNLYRPFLSHVILPHAVFFGYAVGVIELLVGISLLLGIWVRPACLLGIVLLLNITLASWWDVGHGAPIWRYFGSRLDTLPLLLLLIVLFATDAGRVWGLDGILRRRAIISAR
jgi:thiosulfate dehydrogenase [quinone] large subunit